ncbi:MAG: hypothetical protein ACI9MC_000047 [Kiritimatiellia bacterium]|jgi:hypothetical protein
MSRAVCVRCGHSRPEYTQICPSCGHRPVDDGLVVAWLLSSGNLSADQLDVAAARVISGEVIRPSDRQIAKARKALGRAFATDPGLGVPMSLLLLATGVVLTPLPAWICFAWWLNSRPRAAWQAFAAAVPVSLIYLSLGLYWLVLQWLTSRGVVGI